MTLKLKICVFSIFFYTSFFCLSVPLDTVAHIKSEEYFSKVENAIKEAKESIYIVLSSISCTKEDPDNPIYKILRNLVLAQVEGIKVEIILNPEYRYYFTREDKELNEIAWKLIKSSKIPVTFFEENEHNFSNLIIIDEKLIIEGTQPWVEGINTNQNYYNSTKINSKHLAKTKLKLINKRVSSEIAGNSELCYRGKLMSIKVPIFDNNKWEKFLKKESNELFDFYIWLLIKSNKRNEGWFRISISSLRSVFFLKKMPKPEFNKIMLAFLKTLKKWDLINYKKEKSKNFLIKINHINDNSVNIEIPENYFQFHYPKILSLNEKILYFLLLRTASVSRSFPYFIIKEQDIYFDKFKNEEFKANIVQLEKNLFIEPHTLNSLDAHMSYIFLSPRDVRLTNRITEGLVHQYGKKEVEKAMFIAALLNKEKNPEILRDILYYLQELGFLEVQKVFSYVLELPLFHSERNFKTVKKHLVNILKKRLNEQN